MPTPEFPNMPDGIAWNRIIIYRNGGGADVWHSTNDARMVGFPSLYQHSQEYWHSFKQAVESAGRSRQIGAVLQNIYVNGEKV
jgi:hypothetical protein